VRPPPCLICWFPPPAVFSCLHESVTAWLTFFLPCFLDSAFSHLSPVVLRPAFPFNTTNRTIMGDFPRIPYLLFSGSGRVVRLFSLTFHHLMDSLWLFGTCQPFRPSPPSFFFFGFQFLPLFRWSRLFGPPGRLLRPSEHTH